jgi:hypothetical protein
MPKVFDDDGQVDLMSQTARQLGYEFTKPQINQILWALNDSRENMENDDQMFNRYKKINENFYPVGVEYIKRLHASNCLEESPMYFSILSLISFEALFVNVIQRIEDAGIPDSINLAVLSTITLLLPLPGQAVTRHGPSL